MRQLKEHSEAVIRETLLDVEGDVGLTAIRLSVLRGELWHYICQRRDLLDIVERQPTLIVDDAELVLTESLQHKEPWAIVLTLKTLGRKRGWGRFIPQPVALLPRESEDGGDLSRLSTEQRRQFDYFTNKTAGFPDGVRPPDPDWVQRLDKGIDFVRSAFASHFYNSKLAAGKIGVTHEQLEEYLALRPELYQAIGDPRDVLLDMAERGLREAVFKKKKWAVKFVLRTQGRSRGYGDNPHDERPRRAPTAPHAPDMSRLTPDELTDYVDLLHITLGIPEPPHRAWERRIKELEAKNAAKKAEMQKQADAQGK